jgi:DNA modification methylase
MNIEQIKTESLIPYARNAKLHNDSQVAAIAGSIKEFGFNNPVLISADNSIIAGHGRVLAARKLGLSEVPCIRLSHLTDNQRRAYILADNRLSETGGGWDDEMLKMEIGEIDWDDLGDMSFDAFEWGDLDIDCASDDEEAAEVDAEPQIDKAEELREKWGVETGQLWQLGDHRILCGDSTKAEDVERVMDGENADICFTSPPYAQQRDYTKESKHSDWDALMQGVFGALPMIESGQVLVNLGLVHKDGEWWPYWNGWIDWMRSQGWRRFGWYVWDQGSGLPGDWNGRLAPSHEFVFHFNRESTRPNKWMDKKPENIKKRNKCESTTRGKDGKTKAFTNPEASGQPTKIPESVIRIGRQVGSDGHPAQFPVEFPAFIFRSWPGIAYEPFSGSGTTIIACEQLGRKCRAIEISPAYVAVAIQRWADATGKEPRLI